MRDEVGAFRERALRRAERWIGAHARPRLVMGMIVFITGACAFVFSVVMLRMGLTSMGLRYPLAVVLSYGVFLGMLRLWLACQGDEAASYDGKGADMAARDAGYDPSAAAGNLIESAAVLDVSEGFFLAGLAVAAVLAGVVVCFYVVWTAPALLAELLVDGLVMSAVYRRLRRADASSWLSGVFRRTWVAVLVAAVFFSLAGFALHWAAPEAVSVGEAVRHVMRGGS